MATVRMDVNPEVLKYYIGQSELDVEFLKGENNLSNIEGWLDGSKQPTLNQLRQLAKKLRIPLGYLVLKEPVDDSPPILEYRTVDSVDTSKGSRELIDTIRNVQEQQSFVSEYRKNEGFSSLRYVNYFTIDEPIDNVIEFSRTLLSVDAEWQSKLGDVNPFKFFRQKFNEIGILVLVNGIVGQNTQRTLDIEEFRAFTLMDDYAPAIFINNKDTKNGQVFSLLHEFAHLLYGKEEIYNAGNTFNKEPSPLERKCNEFASEMLGDHHLFYNEEYELLERVDPIVFDTVRKSFHQGDIQFTKALRLLNVDTKGFDCLERYYRYE